MAVCFCTLAIHGPYRERARRLCADLPGFPWLILTDEPDHFADLPVRAVRHSPTGPMAIDYLQHLASTGNGRGGAAYHDKRFAIELVLADFDTAIFLDADSRVAELRLAKRFPSGLCTIPLVRKTIAGHLKTCGTWRTPAFVELARELFGDPSVLDDARWCQETCFAVTRDGNQSLFIDAWGRAANFLQQRGVYSGEGGVLGLAAAYAGWSLDYKVLAPMGRAIRHEGGGPKVW